MCSASFIDCVVADRNRVKMSTIVDQDLHIASRVISEESKDEVSLSSNTLDISALINSARSPR